MDPRNLWVGKLASGDDVLIVRPLVGGGDGGGGGDLRDRLS